MRFAILADCSAFIPNCKKPCLDIEPLTSSVPDIPALPAYGNGSDAGKFVSPEPLPMYAEAETFPLTVKSWLGAVVLIPTLPTDDET